MMRKKPLEGEQPGPDEIWGVPSSEAGLDLHVTLFLSPSDNLLA